MWLFAVTVSVIMTEPKQDEQKKESAALRFISGPAAGKDFPFSDRELTVGRAVSAAITIPDNLLSRIHARIYLDGDVYKIEDLESTNGTWIRGERITRPTILQPHTTISIGSSIFELYLPEEEAEEDPELLENLISCRVQPVSMDNLGEAGDEKREQRHLAAIYRFQALLASNLEEPKLMESILQIVTEVVPCDEAHMLKYLADDDAIVPFCARNQNGPVELSNPMISRSVTRYVKNKREGILSVDTCNDERFQGESLVDFNMNSVMCVPMQGKEKLFGLIYLVRANIARVYDENDLKLLTAVGQSAGLAIENGQLIETSIRAARMAAVGMTAASLSHYVKNILAGLEGSVSLLRLGIDKNDKQLMNEAWDILSKNHKHLSSLVLDMLNLAREDSLNLGVYNLTDIVHEAVELAASQSRKDKITVELGEDCREIPVLAEIDSRGIHRVLLNLLNNAIDAVFQRYHDSGEGRVTVNYRVENHGQVAVLEISDNGIGIPEEKLSKVFEMFHTDKGERGTGLGLAVAKRIIDSHNGVILVGSEVNIGSVFTVKFPIRQENTNTRFIKRDSFTDG